MSEVIVLDTHIWIWLINGDVEKIPESWLEQIESAQRVGISPVSCYETSLAVKKERLILPFSPQKWFDQALHAAGIETFPLTADIADRAVNLSPIHKDPFDRMIIATALAYEAGLASVDQTFSKYKELDGYLLAENAN